MSHNCKISQQYLLHVDTSVEAKKIFENLVIFWANSPLKGKNVCDHFYEKKDYEKDSEMIKSFSSNHKQQTRADMPLSIKFDFNMKQ